MLQLLLSSCRRAVVTLVLSVGLFAGSAEAKSVAVSVEGASQGWIARTAHRAAASYFQKLGYEVVSDAATADAVCTVTVHKAYSHHGANPLFLVAGGLIDLWNYDSGHATVETVVRHGDQEVSRHTASATKRDVPLFSWLQAAKRCRTKALSAAVRGSLKEYGNRPAQTEAPRDAERVTSR